MKSGGYSHTAHQVCPSKHTPLRTGVAQALLPQTQEAMSLSSKQRFGIALVSHLLGQPTDLSMCDHLFKNIDTYFRACLRRYKGILVPL